MEYEQMKALVGTHCCARCEGALRLVWDADGDTYKLECGTDPDHQGIKKIPTVTQALARGNMDTIVGPGAQTDLEKQARAMPERFNLLPKKDVETGRELTSADIDSLEAFGKLIGLNIYLGHVCIYYGQPRVTIDGYYYLAKKRDKNISVLALPATKEEYQQYHVPETDFFYLARGWEDNRSLNEVGLGIVTLLEAAEMSKKNPEHKRSPIVASHPQRMAEKRAEWQLLRKIIPLEEA